MQPKTDYNVDDTVWVYGITRDNKLTKGTIVKKFTMDHPNYDNEFYYVVAIPTEIEPLLEIRTWHNISQDSKGPIGAFRNIGTKGVVDKYISKVGYNAADTGEDLDEPTAEEIHAAIERSRQAVLHEPLNLKDKKPQRSPFRRKKK